MQRAASRVPSVACLLYLVADQIAPWGMSGKMLKATKVPCRPVWVHPIRLGHDRSGDLPEPAGRRED